MDSFFETANSAVSFSCAAALSVVVLSRRVKDGIVIKAGLVMMIVSLLVSGLLAFNVGSQQGEINAALLLRAGLLVAIAGCVWRITNDR